MKEDLTWSKTLHVAPPHAKTMRTTSIFRFNDFWHQRLAQSQQAVATVHVMNEQEKKMRKFCKLNMVRLHHCFFQFMGVRRGRECRKFYSSLSNLLSEKRDLPKSRTMNYDTNKNMLRFVKNQLALRKKFPKVAEFESDVVVSELFSRI